MLLFIDTEFTDFINSDLISIGVVSADGREFYGERTDYDRAGCSAFVREAVLPQLGQESPVTGTEAEVGAALRDWLTQFKEIEVCFDYTADLEFFCYLVRDPEDLSLPSIVSAARHIGKDINPVDIELYWKSNGRKAHHALHDARANRFAYSCRADTNTFVSLKNMPRKIG